MLDKCYLTLYHPYVCVCVGFLNVCYRAHTVNEITPLAHLHHLAAEYFTRSLSVRSRVYIVYIVRVKRDNQYKAISDRVWSKKSTTQQTQIQLQSEKSIVADRSDDARAII